MLEIESTAFEGLFALNFTSFADARGSFTKIVHAPTLAGAGLTVDFAETYVSNSRKNVIRGLHYQAPPCEHDKIVTCLAGEVLDVIVDFRPASKTYKRVFSTLLAGDRPRGLYIGAGFAHGFAALSETASMLYLVTSVHAPSSDHGILWSSIDFEWPIAEPIVSARDSALPSITVAVSPF